MPPLACRREMNDEQTNARLGSPSGLPNVGERLGFFSRKRLFWIVLVFGIGFYSSFRFWEYPSLGDWANWDYFAQVIVRGGTPYRDVVNIKSPLSAYIGAAAIVMARPFGVEDVIAIRLMFILLAAFTLAFTFLVARDYFKSMRIALVAAAVMLSFERFALFNSGGIQPKTPMILFGLMVLWTLIKGRPFASGSFGMLSALSWQPGLLFVGVAGLGFTKYLTEYRDKKTLRLLAGAATPLAVLLAYFIAAGALDDFYRWNIVFNATVYAPHEARSLSNFFNHFARIVGNFDYNAPEYFVAALVGLGVAIVVEVRRAIKLGRSHFLEYAPTHAVIIAPITYFVFCMINIQGPPDLIPFLPFVAIFAAVFLVFAADQVVNLLVRFPGLNPAVLRHWTTVTILALVFYHITVNRKFNEARTTLTLRDQTRAVQELTSHLQHGDKVFVHGRTEILALAGLTNASKHFLLDRGKVQYLEKVEHGGFDGWLTRLKEERPRIVVLDRLGTDGDLKPLEEWVAGEYEFRSNNVFAYYIRK